MRALRDASDIVNGGSGKVGHEFVSDGSMWFGQNADPGNTDETAKFPSTVALIWRWTGDNGFRDEMYDFAVRNMRYVVRELDDDGDGWPEGLGNVERTRAWAPRSSTTRVYFIRGLYDLADMAHSKHDGRTQAWAANLARDLQRRFEGAWWMDERGPARRLARREQRADPAEALDHGHSDGGRADGEPPGGPGPHDVRSRHALARPARDGLLQRRRAALQPRPLPHRLRGRADGARASGRSSA